MQNRCNARIRCIRCDVAGGAGVPAMKYCVVLAIRWPMHCTMTRCIVLYCVMISCIVIRCIRRIVAGGAGVPAMGWQRTGADRHGVDGDGTAGNMVMAHGTGTGTEVMVMVRLAIW